MCNAGRRRASSPLLFSLFFLLTCRTPRTRRSRDGAQLSGAGARTVARLFFLFFFSPSLLSLPLSGPAGAFGGKVEKTAEYVLIRGERVSFFSPFFPPLFVFFYGPPEGAGSRMVARDVREGNFFFLSLRSPRVIRKRSSGHRRDGARAEAERVSDETSLFSFFFPPGIDGREGAAGGAEVRRPPLFFSPPLPSSALICASQSQRELIGYVENMAHHVESFLSSPPPPPFSLSA